MVSGFNVYPNEIEEVVASNDKVLEVACIGVASEKTGEAIKVFVVRKDPSLTKEELIDFCRKELTAYKVPKDIEFFDCEPETWLTLQPGEFTLFFPNDAHAPLVGEEKSIRKAVFKIRIEAERY